MPSLQTRKPSGPSPSPARDPARLPNRPQPLCGAASHLLGSRLHTRCLGPAGSFPPWISTSRCCVSSGSPSSRARLGAPRVSGINPASREASLFVV